MGKLCSSKSKEEKEAESIILIGKKDNKELIKVKEFIEDHYFRKHIEHNGEENISYNSELNVTITDDFLKYKDIEYNLVVSFIDSKEKNREIINTFKKTYYLFHRICSKSELIMGTDNIISSENLLLTNHFRIQINNFLGWNKNDSLSECALSEASSESPEINDIKFKD